MAPSSGTVISLAFDPCVFVKLIQPAPLQSLSLVRPDADLQMLYIVTALAQVF